MVRITVLASGSKGNCTVVTTNRTRIALDAGLSCREIVKRMRLRGEEPEKLDALLITHEHSDHVQGLSTLARRWNVPVYITRQTHAAWKRWLAPGERMSFQQWLELRRQANAATEANGDNSESDGEMDAHGSELVAAGHPHTEQSDGNGGAVLAAAEPSPDAASEEESSCNPEAAGPEEAASRTADSGTADADTVESGASRPDTDPTYLPCVEHFCAGVPFEVGDIHVTPFTIPHDAADPVGFLLEVEGLRIAVATDLGYLAPNVRMHLKGADLLMIESNHDVEMLRDGPYPWAVKQRVLSRVGHLSNDAVGEYLSQEYDGGARYVVLAHLSESNNLPELARISAERPLADRMGLLASKVLLASQSTPLESIYL